MGESAEATEDDTTSKRLPHLPNEQLNFNNTNDASDASMMKDTKKRLERLVNKSR